MRRVPLLLLIGLIVAACGSASPGATDFPGGKVVFGTTVDTQAMSVPNPVTAVATSDSLGWVAYLSDSANATALTVTIASVDPGGAETLLATQSVGIADPADNELGHSASTLPATLGAGTYTVRYIRPSDSNVLAAGTITIH